MSFSLLRDARGAFALAALGSAAACGDISRLEPVNDVVPPTLEVTAPAADTMVNTGSFTLVGRAADSMGVARVTYRVDGGEEQAATFSGTTVAPFTIPVTLQAGTNTFALAAYDAVGNRSAVVTRRITVDTTPPVVTLATGDTTVSTGTVEVRGTASDPSGIRRIAYRIGGGDEQAVQTTPDATVQFSFVAALAVGINTIEVAAYDAAGNRTAATLRATRR